MRAAHCTLPQLTAVAPLAMVPLGPVVLPVPKDSAWEEPLPVALTTLAEAAGGARMRARQKGQLGPCAEHAVWRTSPESGMHARTGPPATGQGLKLQALQRLTRVHERARAGDHSRGSGAPGIVAWPRPSGARFSAGLCKAQWHASVW